MLPKNCAALQSVILRTSCSISCEPALFYHTLQSIAPILSVHLLQCVIYIQIARKTPKMDSTASPRQKIPRARRFREMFNELKVCKAEGNASIQCAAKQQGVSQCKSYVDLTGQILEMLPTSIIDVQFQLAVQLLETMLCPSHHHDTKYVHMLLLDWYDSTLQDIRRLGDGLRALAPPPREEQRTSRDRAPARLSLPESLPPRPLSIPAITRIHSTAAQSSPLRFSGDIGVGEKSPINFAIRSSRPTMPGAWDFEDQHQSSSRIDDWLLGEYQCYVEIGRCPSKAHSSIINLNTIMVECVSHGSINCIAKHSNGSRCPMLISQSRAQAARSKIEYLQQSNTQGKRGRKPNISNHIAELIQHMLCSVHLCFHSLYAASVDYDLVFSQISASESSQIGSAVEGPSVPDPQHIYTGTSQMHLPAVTATPPRRPSSPPAPLERASSTSTAFVDASSSMLSDESSGLESSPMAGRGGQRESNHSMLGLPSPAPSTAADNDHEQSFDSSIPPESSYFQSTTPEPEMQGIQRRPTNLFRNPSEITHSLKDAMDGRVKVFSRVYILESKTNFKSKESGHAVQLVKIGISGNPTKRRGQIRKCRTPGCGGTCRFGKLNEFASFNVAAPFHRRAELLCHKELDNFNCLHLNLDGIEPEIIVNRHREWFLVSTDVATKSVKRWVDFVNAAYNPDGRINDFWSEHIGSMPDPLDEERTSLENKQVDVHHELRHNRLQMWLDEGLEKQPKLKP